MRLDCGLPVVCKPDGVGVLFGQRAPKAEIVFKCNESAGQLNQINTIASADFLF